MMSPPVLVLTPAILQEAAAAVVLAAENNLLQQFPSTAELMQKCLAVNPFEAQFRRANNRRISTSQLELGGLLPPPTINLPDVNGAHSGVNVSGADTTSGISLLKQLPTSMAQSPGIFSNIDILAADISGMSENLKTADFSKLIQQIKEQGGSSSLGNETAGAAPRTADVLNAVLDMHSDRLHTLNYIAKPDFSIFQNLTPTGSAPNSAGILNVATLAAQCAASTSGGLLAPPRASPGGISPRGGPTAATSMPSTSALTSLDKQRSPGGLDMASLQPKHTGLLTTMSSAMAGAMPASVVVSNAVDPGASWDPRDVKPSLGKDMYDDDLGMGGGMPTVASTGPTSLTSLDGRSTKSSDREMSPLGTSGPISTGRGRGRGRAALTPDMPAEERNLRLTILERNKAAAVRYRKRKKEEHDDMITRVHGLESDKVQLATQNQVLRREVERLRAALTERETRCVCLKGVLPLTATASSEVDLMTGGHGGAHGGGMYHPSQSHAAQQLINGLGLPNGMPSLKRPKM